MPINHDLIELLFDPETFYNIPWC